MQLHIWLHWRHLQHRPHHDLPHAPGHEYAPPHSHLCFVLFHLTTKTDLSNNVALEAGVGVAAAVIVVAIAIVILYLLRDRLRAR